jgi:hypothetical protein
MRTTRYDALVATGIGIMALLVSGYTAYVQRQQVRAQVWPMLALSFNHNPAEMKLFLDNKGTGPAIVKDVRLTVDGQPVRSWDDLLSRLPGPGGTDHSYGYISGRVVSAGENVVMLNMGPPTPGSPGERLWRGMKLLGMEICYCSTLGDCWRMSAPPGDQPPETVEVRGCQSPSAASFRQ